MNLGFFNKDRGPMGGDLDDTIKGPALGLRGLGSVAVASEAPTVIDVSEFEADRGDTDWAQKVQASEEHVQKLENDGRNL